MAERDLKRKLGWLELALYGGGVALIAVFLLVRSEGERLRQEGLEAFTAANTAPQTVQGRSSTDQGATGSSGGWQPDQAQWSKARIEDFNRARMVEGEQPLAVLSIDHLDVIVPVYNGTDDLVLDRGVGRIKGTSWIDNDGNLGIAGHRDSFFRPLKDIEIGDKIDLQTARGTITYEVSSIDITDPSDVSVLAPTQERTLTLVTCYPFYYVGHAPQRFIVKATAEHFLVKT